MENQGDNEKKTIRFQSTNRIEFATDLLKEERQQQSAAGVVGRIGNYILSCFLYTDQNDNCCNSENDIRKPRRNRGR